MRLLATSKARGLRRLEGIMVSATSGSLAKRSQFPLSAGIRQFSLIFAAEAPQAYALAVSADILLTLAT